MAESRFYAPSGWQGAGEAIQALLLQQEEQKRRDRLEATRRQEVASAAQRDQQRIDLQRTRDTQDVAKQQYEQDKYARERTDAAAKIAIENNLHPDQPTTQDAANTVGSSGLYGSFLKRGTLPSTTRMGSLPGPAISQSDTAPDAAPVQPPQTPGVLSGPVTQAGGDNFLRATPGQQKVLDEQKALADLVADPAVAGNPQVQLILKGIKATGDTAGGYAAIASILNNQAKPDTQELFRTSADRKTVERFDNGQWVPHTGAIPKDAHWLQEPTPSSFGPAHLDPVALAVYAQLIQSGAINPNLTRTNAPVINAALTSIAGQGAGAVDDLTTAGAEYAADRKSLGSITSSLNSITAFEGMANRNIDTLKGALKTLPDSGYGFLNSPMRVVLGKTGDPNVARFQAALRPVQSEVARILAGSPSLTGVTSVHGQEEVEKMLPADYTVGQFLAALPVLQQDMKSRQAELQSMQTQITAGMKGRGQKRGAAPADGADPNATADQIIKDYFDNKNKK